MYLKLRNGTVALKEILPSDKTESGIYIPETVEKGPLRVGEILETGPGELIQGRFVEMDLKVGQQVVFDIGHTASIDLDGRSYIICNMVDVIATIEKERPQALSAC